VVIAAIESSFFDYHQLMRPKKGLRKAKAIRRAPILMLLRRSLAEEIPSEVLVMYMIVQSLSVLSKVTASWKWKQPFRVGSKFPFNVFDVGNKVYLVIYKYSQV